MIRQSARRIFFRKSGKQLPPALLFCLLLSGLTGCNGFFYSSESVGKSPSQKTQAPVEAPSVAELSDKEFNRYMAEWQNVKPSVERLAEMENDLTFLLNEVSKMSDIDNIPGQPARPVNVVRGQSVGGTAARGQSATGSNLDADGNLAASGRGDTDSEESGYGSVPGSGFSIGVTQCSAPPANNYRKSIAFASFPRALPSSSNVGALYQVEQHLPLLLSANLTTRHAALSPVHLPEGFYSASYQGEARAAAQAQLLARKHRTQFIVSGEVRDMSMTHPDKAFTHNAYKRLVNTTNNLFNADSPKNSKSRIFSFQLQLRDGFTGQVVFEHQYDTYGNWDTKESAQMGFGSPRFWQTDYGRKVQQLVAKASDDMAATVDCRPYMARVDLRPGRQQVIIHSGANNGLRAGDALELHQLVMHPVTGEYNNFDTHLVNRNTLVYLTEVYPSHSVANIGSDILLNGQYLALAP